MTTERTAVGIIGAGPAGLMLAHLLRLAGIDAIVIEARTRDYCETRIRAGLMEQGSVDLMDEIGATERLRREALVHDGIYLRFNGHSHHIDIRGTTGRSMYIYGQQEIVKDLIALQLAAGGEIRFECSNVSIQGIDAEKPSLRYQDIAGNEVHIVCDFVAGCDGFHGVSRPSIPESAVQTYDREYPFAWLGILGQSPPIDPELVYVHHPDGFALFTMRSNTMSRLYLQVSVDEDIAQWSDDRIWTELHHRLEGDETPPLIEGPVLQKTILPMRSFMTVPMRFRRLFLAGDSAHIVPPTGAKGMNLAMADVAVLASAFDVYYKTGSAQGLDAYSDTALRRAWGAARFSWWMTSLTHMFNDRLEFDNMVQLSELHYITTSRAGAETLAEQYVGLPIER